MLYELLIIMIIGISQMEQICAQFGVLHVDMLNCILWVDGQVSNVQILNETFLLI